MKVRKVLFILLLFIMLFPSFTKTQSNSSFITLNFKKKASFNAQELPIVSFQSSLSRKANNSNTNRVNIPSNTPKSKIQANSLLPEWYDFNNQTTPLNNFSFIDGPHAKINLTYPQIANQINLTISKGYKSGQVRTDTLSIGNKIQSNITIDVIEGEKYNFTLTWDKPSWDMDFRFFDNNSKLIPYIGCTNPDHLIQYGGICSVNFPEVITNFISPFTGKLKVEVSLISYIGSEFGSSNFLFTAQDYQEYNLTILNTNYFILDTAVINGEIVWNGPITINSLAKFGVQEESAVLYLTVNNWFSPKILTLNFNNEQDICNLLSHSISENSLNWRVVDVNAPTDENITYYIQLAKPNQKLLSTIAVIKDSSVVNYTLDTYNNYIFPSGNYTLKLIASDSRLNSSKIINFFIDMQPYDDADNDTIPSQQECSIGMNPFINDFYGDLDNDGMPNGWEYEHGLNVTNNDAGGDLDQDGILNYYEYENSLDPNNASDANLDKDGDGISNLDEFENWLNASNKLDAGWDNDGDGINNSWEIKYNFSISIKNSDIDPDHDGLSNLLESKSGTNPWIADSDGDGLPDGLEYYAGLSPIKNMTDGKTLDGMLDTDGDGIPNLWEYQHSMNMTDPTDAYADFDGDGVSNLNEYYGNSDPNNFFSVPLLSASYIHIFLVLFIFVTGTVLFVVIRKNKANKVRIMSKIGVMNYSLAKSINKVGYNNYSEYLLDIDKGKTFLYDSTDKYHQEKFFESIQLNERAYEIFHKNKMYELEAESVFNIIRSQKELNLLSKGSIILNLFPNPTKSSQETKKNIESIKLIIEGIIEEYSGNLGLSEELIAQAVLNKNLQMKFQLVCMGKLIELEFRKLMADPFTTFDENFIQKIENWKSMSEKSKDKESTSRAYLLKSTIELLQRNIDQARHWIDKCILICDSEEIFLIKKIALERKETIITQMQALDKRTNREDMAEYVKNAKDYLKKID